MLPHVHPAESGVRLVRGIVKDVQLNKLIVDNGEEVMVCLYGPSKFVTWWKE
jgi:hypothetical protein